jgi:hypothetical protein
MEMSRYNESRYQSKAESREGRIEGVQKREGIDPWIR